VLTGRRAFTVAELIVAITLAGVAFGAFALVVAQQTRTYGELARDIRAQGQASEGAAALGIDLRGLSPASGDIAPGGARDSAIEFRATVAMLYVCTTRDRSIVVRTASLLSTPKASDTAWLYVPGDSVDSWVPIAVGSIAPPTSADSVACRDAAAAPPAAELHRRGYVLELAQDTAARTPVGSPVRLTRTTRYSLYKAPDGLWYLGRREFSAALGRFETIQPVSGPYRPYAPPADSSSGLELRYFDREGGELPDGELETHVIARIAVTIRPAVRGGGLDPPDGRRVTWITVTPRELE
jgi:hypothetical protein